MQMKRFGSNERAQKIKNEEKTISGVRHNWNADKSFVFILKRYP